MTRLWSEGEVVEVLRHPRCEGAGTAWDVQPMGIPSPAWRRPASDWHIPDSFVWQGTFYRILAVCNRWRVHTRWWEPDQTLWREYIKVLVAPATKADKLDRSSDYNSEGNGLLCLLYRDLLLGKWFLARIYD